MDKLRIDPAVAAVYSILITGVTYLVCVSNKRKAQTERTRDELVAAEAGFRSFLIIKWRHERHRHPKP